MSKFAEEAAARGVYRSMFPEIDDSTLDDHFDWYKQGSEDPESCVHYSNVEKAYRFARAALEAVAGGKQEGE